MEAAIGVGLFAAIELGLGMNLLSDGFKEGGIVLVTVGALLGFWAIYLYWKACWKKEGGDGEDGKD